MEKTDLFLGAVVLACLASGSFACGFLLVRRMRAWVSAGALCGVAATVVLGSWKCGSLQTARLLPFSNAIVLGNWLPLAAGTIMGGIAAVQRIPVRRRLMLGGILGALAWQTVLIDVLSPPLQPGQPIFCDGFCMQSTSTSCSACCAVELLMHHGIPATEAEMMRLCLTRGDGTPELGLYRGLKLKTRGTPWDVEIVSGDFESFRRPEGVPAIVFVGVGGETLYSGKECPPGQEELYTAGSHQRQSHAMLVCGFYGRGTVETGDPSVGRRRRPTADLRRAWTGVGIRLVRRPASTA